MGSAPETIRCATRPSRLLLQQALDVPAARRAAFLEQHCQDAALRREVESLLRHHALATGFLSAPPLLDGAPNSRAPGDVVAERYRLEGEIGRGGFGRVHAAYDLLNGEVVAVKLLDGWGSGDLGRLRSEIACLRLLRVPGVVALIDEGVHGETPFLAMELVSGSPFPGRGRARSWLAVRSVAIELLRTLSRVHANGLLHRDLKPANVLVDDAGNPTILDFGLANALVLGGGPENVRGFGTPAYAAPEQHRGEALDGRADLFAVGAMLIEALSGVLPARDGDGSATGALGALPDDTPEPVARMLASLVADAPSDRPASALAVAQELAAPSSAEPRVDEESARLERWLDQQLGDEQRVTEEDLLPLFTGPERLFHLRSDAAREMMRATHGAPARVAEEVRAWLSSGLANWTGDGLALSRAALDRMRLGLAPRVLDAARAAGQGEVSERSHELLTWIELARPHATSKHLTAWTGWSADEVAHELDRLAALDHIARDKDGRCVRLAPLSALAPWPPERRRAAHRAIAATLAPDTEGRLLHLVAAGDDGVAREAATLSRRLAESGHLGEAEAVLSVGIASARGAGDSASVLALLRVLVRLALLAFDAPTFDRTLFELLRTKRPEVEPLRALIEAALRSIESDGERALAPLDRMAPLEDPDLEGCRQSARARAASMLPLPRHDELMGELERWANENGEFARLELWRGLHLYRHGEFERAAEAHERSAALAERASDRSRSLLNAASAWMEAQRLDRVRAIARDVLALAASCRHPAMEGRATWLLRAAEYRGGADLEPDTSLIELLGRTGVQQLAALGALNEAACAWRAGDAGLAAELAERSARGWSSLGNRWPAALSSALAYLCGRRDAGTAARLIEQARACPLPRIAAQTAALLEAAGVRGLADVRARARDVPRLTGDARSELRWEVLSPRETLSVTDQHPGGRDRP